MSAIVHDFSFTNGEIVHFQYNKTGSPIESEILGKFVEDGNLWYIITPTNGRFDEHIVVQKDEEKFISLENITLASPEEITKIEKEK